MLMYSAVLFTLCHLNLLIIVPFFTPLVSQIRTTQFTPYTRLRAVNVSLAFLEFDLPLMGNPPPSQ